MQLKGFSTLGLELNIACTDNPGPKAHPITARTMQELGPPNYSMHHVGI